MNQQQENLVLKGTESTPSVKCTVDTGVIEITGRSLLNDSEIIFSQVASWVDLYLKKNKEIKFSFNFDYINSSSNYHLLSLLKNVCRLDNVVVTIDWHYEDEDIYDIGLDYKELLPELTFNFYEVK